VSYVIAYVAALVFFLAVDAVWIKFIIKPVFDRHVADLMAEQMRLGVAAGFYLLYVAGTIYMAVGPGLRGAGWGPVALNGAILGFLAYGTYEATNMATLRGWSWSMVTMDVAWGTVLTSATALVGYFAARALGYGAA
jgi:uncharacterized membrane protein